MTTAEWSWITCTASVLGCWLMGRSPRWGWTYGIPLELLWITSGMETGRWGDCAMASVFLALNVYHLYRWRGTAFRPARTPIEFIEYAATEENTDG